MDNLLVNGDVVLQDDRIKTITSTQETIQRILISLLVKKGKFLLSPELGSTLHEVDINLADDFTLFAIVSDAVSGIEGVSLKNLEKHIDYQDASMELTLFFDINGEDVNIEIDNTMWG